MKKKMKQWELLLRKKNNFLLFCFCFNIVVASSIIYKINQSYYQAYPMKKLEKSLDDNHKLSKEEKAFIESMFSILEDNQKYINMNNLEKKLSHLDVEIDNDYNILGVSYNSYQNYIYISGEDSFLDVIENDEFKDELSYQICYSFSTPTSELGNSLQKAMAGVLSDEYNSSHSIVHSYNDHVHFDKQRMCLYALLEIVGVDSLKELYFKGDINPLLTDLISIIADKELATDLIQEIDNLDDFILDESDLLEQKIYEKIKNYFDTKYGYPMEENETMMTYLVYSGFYSQYNSKDIYIKATDIIPKGYFSENYIEEHPNLIYDASIEFLDFDYTYPNTPISVDFNELYSKNTFPIKCFSGRNRITIDLEQIEADTFIPNQNYVNYKEVLEKSLADNDKLTESEKEFISSLFPLLEDNQEYVNLWRTRDQLSNYDIIYNQEEYENIRTSSDWTLYYNPSNVYTYIKDFNSFEEIMEDDKTKHYLSYGTCNLFCPFSILGSGLQNAMVEVMNYEYGISLDNPSFYSIFDERMCLYALLEIVDVDCLKELYFKGDVNPLLIELMSIVDDKDMADNLIVEIDKLNWTKETNFSEYETLKRDIYQKIKTYFEEKYEYPMEENETMMVYMKYAVSNFSNDHFIENEEIKAYNIIPKGYFNEDYMEEHPNLVYDISIEFKKPYFEYPNAPISVDFYEFYMPGESLPSTTIYFNQVEIEPVTSYQKRK